MQKTLIAIAAAASLGAPLAASAAPEFEPRGRFHLDYAFNDSDATELGDGFLNRRARIGVSGKFDDLWSFQIEYDFAENGTSANDVYVARKLGGGSLQIGQFKVPFGLNELTSSNRITFIERASPSNIVADSRRLGIGYSNFSGPIGFQTMVYGRGIGDNAPDAGAGADMPIGAAVRAVFNPNIGASQMLHLGAAIAYEDRQDFNTLRFRDRPESRARSSTRLIDTGSISDVDSTLKAGLEFAYQTGPLSAQAEYFYVDVSRDAGPEPTFDGFYLQASYMLTGESRGYRNGVMRAPTPAGRAGAWEVAARYSSVDLIDSGFVGGEQDNITLGLNWYATSKVRFMANVIFVNVENGTAGVDDEPTIVALRAQYSF